jgi:hypothetical protein
MALTYAGRRSSLPRSSAPFGGFFLVTAGAPLRRRRYRAIPNELSSKMKNSQETSSVAYASLLYMTTHIFHGHNLSRWSTKSWLAVCRRHNRLRKKE